MRKFFALLLALTMVFSMAATAFAAETTTLTITDKTDYAEDRSYEAYKIMTATVSGLNFNYDLNAKYTDILKSVLNLDATAVEKDFTDAISGKNDAQMRDFAEALFAEIEAAGLAADASWVGDTTTLDQAYWLIVDVTNLEGTNYSNSLVMIDTIGDVTVEIQNKPNTTTTTKHLDDENDSILNPSEVSEDGKSLQDGADYDIGDKVPYTIDIDLASNIARYDYYSFIIQDQIDQGLTYVEDSFAITVRGVTKSIEPKGTVGADFWYEIETVEVDGVQTSQSLYVYPAHGYTTHKLNTETTDILNDYVTVEPNKVDGGDFLKLFPAGTEPVQINSSEVLFTYECLLNENAIVGEDGNLNEYTLKFSNNPYDDGFGETPKETNIVLTYKFTFNKVDTDKNPLPGADFELYKFIAKYPADTTEETTGLEQHPYLNQWGIYEKITRKTTDVVDDPETDEDEAVAATSFTFNGLDDGLYRIVETKVPAGFNGIDPIEFRIVADHVTLLPTNGANLENLEVRSQYTGQLEVTYNKVEGSMTTAIENRSGTELPTTGGMGTTLFYILGTIMVAGAAVMLVTKKRMSVEG